MVVFYIFMGIMFLGLLIGAGYLFYCLYELMSDLEEVEPWWVKLYSKK